MANQAKAIWRYIKKRILWFAAGLAVLTGIITNFDSLADVWSKHRSDPDVIAPFTEAINRQSIAQSPGSPVLLELVQTPKEQAPGGLVFDLYLHNTGPDDILLSSLTYADGYYQTSAGIDPHLSYQVAPNASYEIPVRSSTGETVALSPPYLLKGRSRGAIRVQFTSDKRASYQSTLAFKVFDAAGHQVAAVNAMKGH